MLIGKTLRDRYLIHQNLGSGGFGDTYLAKDLYSSGNSFCVVKHLKPKDSKPDILIVAKKLFDREAQFLYRLGQHDRIPKLYDHFEEQGEFYLVQEFIEGYDLTQEIIAGQSWSEENLLHFLQEILEVLSVIHQENAIHRDIKPSNIRRRKRDGKLVLIDFGAVKEIGSLTVDSDGLTSATIGIGSPGYMPNEQSNGKPKLASDIYAVGTIAIQALTGVKPNQLEEDPQTGELLWRHLVTHVSDRTANFLSKMTRNHFKDRYQNAPQALRALLAPIESQDTLLPTATTLQQTNIKESPPPAKVSLPTIIMGLTTAGAIAIAGLATVRIPVSSPSSSFIYKELETALAAQNWQEADLQTNRIMLKVAQRDDEGWLDSRSIKNFPCEEFYTIDRLWLKYSNGRFGFSVQKPIYLETGNKLGEYNPIAFRIFGERVGWRENGYWKSHDDLGFDLLTPKGHLPRWGPFNDLGDWEESIILKRCYS
jgi:eukaryotic-like serine/threonine-protein kinase